MDFHSLLAVHLRELMYNASIIPSEIHNPEFEWGKDLPRFLPCVEVGFPKPGLQFLCIDQHCYWKYSKDEHNLIHLSKSGIEPIVMGGVLGTGKYYSWRPLGPLHDPTLIDRIMDIVNDYGTTIRT